MTSTAQRGAARRRAAVTEVLMIAKHPGKRHEVGRWARRPGPQPAPEVPVSPARPSRRITADTGSPPPGTVVDDLARPGHSATTQ